MRSYRGIFLMFIFATLNCSMATAKETVNDITQLNPIAVDRVVAPTSIDEVSKLVGEHHGPISIGGGRYSQGGQTATENALFLDMRQMDHIVNLDVEKRQITVEAGITWRKIQEVIDRHDLSLKIMQSYSNFTVGGSLSVNAHGRYVGEGSLIRSVESILIVLADGTVKEASRTRNPELFFGAIGGYGGIGVIVHATLNLAENTHVERTTSTMPVSAYKDYFFENIRTSKRVVFHNADLYPPTYTQVNAVTWSITGKPVTVPEKLAPQDALSPMQQSIMRWISDGPMGKQVRQYLYDPYRFAGEQIEWRNYEASYDVIGLEPPSRQNSTFVLQEYFIPVEHFDAFVPKLAAILNGHNVNVLNVSIRHALPDTESLLSWAPKEVFSFVIYYEQGVTADDKKAVREWTSEVIDAALAEGGTYYLPYQIVATKAQFLQAYPKAPDFFALKKQVDPDYKFRNKLWDNYYGSPR